jgi:hypothetical protein
MAETCTPKEGLGLFVEHREYQEDNFLKDC